MSIIITLDCLHQHLLSFCLSEGSQKTRVSVLRKGVSATSERKKMRQP